MEDFDDLWDQLVHIEAAYLATRPEDVDERERLHSCKRDVKGRMTLHIMLRDRPKDRGALEAELAARGAQLAAHMATRINTVFQLGAGGTSFSGVALTGGGGINSMNVRIDEAGGRADIERRIAQIRADIELLDREQNLLPFEDEDD